MKNVSFDFAVVLCSIGAPDKPKMLARCSGVAMGRSAPCGKIGVIPGKLERKKYFEGYKNFRKGYNRAVDERKIRRTKKILGYETKISRGGQFSISPGLRPPSYATGSVIRDGEHDFFEPRSFLPWEN